MESRVFLAVRRFCRRRRCRRGYPVRAPWRYTPGRLILLLVGLAAVYVIASLEIRLRPIAEQLAVRQVNNLVTSELNKALSDLSGEYSELIEIQYSGDGTITAVTGNMDQINRIRSRAVQVCLDTVAAIDVHTLGVPLGSLFDFDLLWAKGPEIQVHSLVAGTVSAHISGELTSAGINQTLYRMMLDVEVPLTVLLSGSREATTVCVSVCVAQAVIVGQVPQTYLNMPGGLKYGS